MSLTSQIDCPIEKESELKDIFWELVHLPTGQVISKEKVNLVIRAEPTLKTKYLSIPILVNEQVPQTPAPSATTNNLTLKADGEKANEKKPNPTGGGSPFSRAATAQLS